MPHPCRVLCDRVGLLTLVDTRVAAIKVDEFYGDISAVSPRHSPFAALPKVAKSDSRPENQ